MLNIDGEQISIGIDLDQGARLASVQWRDIQFAVPFDPNIRPAVLDNRDLYVAAVEKWVAISSAVKVSDDDLNWLYPDQSIESVVNRWLSDGVALVVVTFGGNGLTGFTSDGKVEVGAVKVDVVDTVGAGDTVGAVLVEAIIEKGLANLNGDDLKATLARAAKAAAITCSRSGAKPPSKLEIVNA